MDSTKSLAIKYKKNYLFNLYSLISGETMLYESKIGSIVGNIVTNNNEFGYFDPVTQI